jgi:anti-anti-sigma factor
VAYGVWISVFRFKAFGQLTDKSICERFSRCEAVAERNNRSVNSSEAGVSLSVEGGGSRLALSGSIQLELARQIHQAAVAAADSSNDVLVDCSAAEHLDGGTLQILLALKKAVEGTGRRFRLDGASEQVRRYLAWSGLADHFAGVSEQAADAAVREPEPPVRPRKRGAARRKRQS